MERALQKKRHEPVYKIEKSDNYCYRKIERTIPIFGAIEKSPIFGSLGIAPIQNFNPLSWISGRRGRVLFILYTPRERKEQLYEKKLSFMQTKSFNTFFKRWVQFREGAISRLSNIQIAKLH